MKQLWIEQKDGHVEWMLTDEDGNESELGESTPDWMPLDRGEEWHEAELLAEGFGLVVESYEGGCYWLLKSPVSDEEEQS